MTLDEALLLDAEWAALYPSDMPILLSGIGGLMDDWGWRSYMDFDVDSWFLLLIREAIK